jgi:hypothetical protein
MSENSIKLQALIAEINKQREGYTPEGVAAIGELYKTVNRKQRRPQKINDSSFLFIRTYEGDLGNRPLPSMNFWNTPDISFSALTGTTPLVTNQLQAGATYRVRCKLYNRGDITVPFPKVDFYLTDPSLGFDTRFATFIGVTQMDGLLLANGIGEADFIYRVPPEEAGHKCFFARTFSFSPLDKPHDIYSLDPVTDRHTGQKNLNIVGQASNFVFNLVHMPNANETIQFLPVTIKEIIGLAEPALGNLSFREGASTALFTRGEMKVLTEKRELSVKRGRVGFAVLSKGDGPDVREHTEILKAYTNAIAMIGAGKAKASQFKELFTQKKKISAFMQQTKMSIQVPQFDLKPGEAIGVNIINTDSTTGIVKGGITMIVVG